MDYLADPSSLHESGFSSNGNRKVYEIPIQRTKSCSTGNLLEECEAASSPGQEQTAFASSRPFPYMHSGFRDYPYDRLMKNPFPADSAFDDFRSRNFGFPRNYPFESGQQAQQQQQSYLHPPASHNFNRPFTGQNMASSRGFSTPHPSPFYYYPHGYEEQWTPSHSETFPSQSMNQQEQIPSTTFHGYNTPPSSNFQPGSRHRYASCSSSPGGVHVPTSNPAPSSSSKMMMTDEIPVEKRSNSPIPMPYEPIKREETGGGHHSQASSSSSSDVNERYAAVLNDIDNEIDRLTARLEKFEGVRGDPEHLYIEEMLTKCLLRCDSIVGANVNDEVRCRRRDVVKKSQESLRHLEKVVGAKSGSQDNNNNDNNEDEHQVELDNEKKENDILEDKSNVQNNIPN